MDRAKKPQVIAALKQRIESADIVIVTSQLGLSVPQSDDLRARVREAGGSFQIAKNTLARLAVAGTAAEAVSASFVGPTGVAVGSDPVALAKAVSSFANGNDKFKVVSGFMQGQVLNAAQVDALSKLPSLDALRGTLIGLILAPATKIAGVVQAPASQLARLFAAYAKKDS